MDGLTNMPGNMPGSFLPSRPSRQRAGKLTCTVYSEWRASLMTLGVALIA